MKLIADSGSTKTAWCLLGEGKEKDFVMTQGINPFQQQTEDIERVLTEELLPALVKSNQGEAFIRAAILEIFFYGAGCTPEASPKVETALQRTMSANCKVLKIEVRSDMLGAARALCQRTPGIVAILGTGANSCLYDGQEIVANVSPLGYILGDEGSGGYIGKRLVGDVLKCQFPEEVYRMFYEETQETAASIIQKTYREPLANRFLASLSPFCLRHRDHPAIHAFLLDCFQQFFIRNIKAYARVSVDLTKLGDYSPSTVHFVGSIASYYQPELTEAAASLGYTVGHVLQAPIEGLVTFHG